MDGGGGSEVIYWQKAAVEVGFWHHTKAYHEVCDTVMNLQRNI